MLILQIEKCARCGNDHEVQFQKFTRPAGEWTHFGECPMTNEPVLLKKEFSLTDEIEKFHNPIETD